MRMIKQRFLAKINKSLKKETLYKKFGIKLIFLKFQILKSVMNLQES
jgi:hypothetical protein